MRTCCIVAYPFPPAGGAPVRRTLKFLKFLPRHGWRAAVLTVKAGLARNPDPSLLAEIPAGTSVCRTASLGGLIRLSGGDVPGGAAGARPLRSGRLWNRAYSFLGSLMGIPDAFILWAPFAVARGLAVIRKERCEVIYATAPPFTDHLVGALLARITGRPLILDFRDAWVAEPAKRWPNRTRKRIETLLEAFVVRTAHAVIAATDGVTEDFRRRYPAEPPEKFVTIPNGFDRDDVPHVSSAGRPPDGKVRIVHTGILRLERTPKEFLEAARMLLDARPELEDRLEVVFVGKNLPFNDGRTVEEYIREFRLERVVRLPGFVSRKESIEYQASADILLLIIGRVPPDQTDTYGVAGKAFDYMMMEKPILAIADPGPVSELIERTGTGICLAPAQVREIKEALEGAILGRPFAYRPRTGEIERYDFARLAEQLAGLFERTARVGVRPRAVTLRCTASSARDTGAC